MKNILNKYKIQLISTGVLLSIALSVPIINSNLQKADASKMQIELESDAILEVYDNEQMENNELVIENDEILADQDENIQEKVDEKDDSEKKVAEIKPSNTVTSTVVKEQASSIRTEESNITSTAPITGDHYTVKKGDTLFLIAQRANTSADQLKNLNNLSSDIIYENQTLKIKGTVNAPASQVASRGSERSEDLYWLSRIIHSEAQGESYEGKVAVGNVIMNRVSSGQFPNTIKGVVFDKQHGYTQFSPVIDGTIYNNPGADSIRAATEVLNGARPVGNALYFLNPRKATNFWIVQNRKFMKTIGLHDFYY